MNSRGLSGIVPCKLEDCPNIASVLARHKNGTFFTAHFCNAHIPDDWEIIEGTRGAEGVDILQWRYTKQRPRPHK